MKKKTNNVEGEVINGIKLVDATFYCDKVYAIIEDGIQTGDAVISFVNGEFHRCNFPFSGHYSKTQWKILGLLAAEIERIDSRVMKPQ